MAVRDEGVHFNEAAPNPPNPLWARWKWKGGGRKEGPSLGPDKGLIPLHWAVCLCVEWWKWSKV